MVLVVVIVIVVGEYVVVVGQPSFLSIVASNRRCICLFGGGERDGGRIPLDGITMADFGDFPCFPKHQMLSFSFPTLFLRNVEGRRRQLSF